MRALGIIPARGGSKAVPRKNIRPIAGKPLIAWTIEAALACPLLSRVVVTTDDEEIAAISRSFGADVPFLRPAELATDQAQTWPVLQHAIRFLDAQGEHFEVIALLQPTTPLRTATQLTEALALMDTGCDSVVSVVSVGGHHPFRMKRIVGDNRLINFIDQGFEDMRPRQALPPVYLREGSIYITRRHILMEQNSMVGGDVRAYVIAPDDTVNIDTLDDFARAEQMLNRRSSAA